MSPARVSFRVVAETPDLLVVNKPAGLLVHPTKPDGPWTMLDGLRELLAYEMHTGGQVSLINRLDRETSGLVLIAKRAEAASRCAKAMQAGRIHKEYLAIAEGWPESDEFTVDEPLLRLGEVAESRIYLKRAAHPDGQPSVTRFRVEERGRFADGVRFSRIRAWPLTGRTHQIRVHLAHAGFPLFGDKIYGPDDRLYLEFVRTGWTENLAKRLRFPRHLLHSARLRLEYEGQMFDWTSLPPARAEDW